jgi:VWFA-related protein
MRMQWGRFFLVFVSCGAIALAQKPLDVPPVATQPSGRQAGSITFDVVVTDKGGHPIQELKQEDFTLLDNKQPATIRSFEAHEIEGQHADSQGLFLVIDDVNANFNTVSIVRTQIETFLHANGGHLAVPTAIFLLTDSGLNQITSVSSDGNALADVLHKAQGQLREIPRSTGFYGGEEKLEISLNALAGLANHLGQASGRKLVVWLGPGWPIFDSPNVIVGPQQQGKFFSSIVGLSSMLRENDITLYAVDPIGTADAASSRTFLWESFTKAVTKPSKSNPGNLALQVFAVHSGGIVLSGSNDITGEIEKCANDASVWYSFSFDSQRADSPNAWHDVQVKVDKPGTVVRTSNGYYAQP